MQPQALYPIQLSLWVDFHRVADLRERLNSVCDFEAPKREQTSSAVRALLKFCIEKVSFRDIELKSSAFAFMINICVVLCLSPNSQRVVQS